MKKLLATKRGRFAIYVVVALLGAPIVIALNRSSAAEPTVHKGTTVSFGVLAASTVTNTGPTSISGTAGGYVGLYPGTSFTGSTGVTRTGDHITDFSAQLAQTDLITAYNDLGVPSPSLISSSDLAGRTILPGAYATTAGTFSNSGNVIFDALGDPSAIFIFQAASTVITSTNSTMTLTGGAQACNVYWQVGSSATLGVSSTFVGHVYALASITATTNATIYGQLLARNGAVTLDSNTIINNNCVAVSTTTTTTMPVTTTTTTSAGISEVTSTTAAQTTTTVPVTATTTRPTATTVRPTATTIRPTATTVRLTATTTTVRPTATTVRPIVTTVRPTVTTVRPTATTVSAVSTTSTLPRESPALPATR